MFNKTYIHRLFNINPTIHNLLLDAPTSKTAKNFLLTYAEEFVRVMNRDISRIKPLEWALQMSCIQVFKRIISTRSEKLTKFNISKSLWLLAHQKFDELPSELNDAFFEEMMNLFLGMRGQSGIYDQEKYPEYMDYHGREAAVLRSEQLDQMAMETAAYIKRYPSGLEQDIIQKREKNKKRILAALNASENDWDNHLWHIQNVIRNSSQLTPLVQLSDEEKKSIDLAKEAKLPFGITPYYVSLMDFESDRRNDHAVRAQVIPPLSYVEAMIANSEKSDISCDFMLEHDTSPIDLITRRYPNIVIFKPYNTCSQICVYCQRNWEIDDVLFPQALASKEKINAAINWLKEHPAITEVLVTGGDPLVMNDKRIDYILSKISEIEHIERIRIGSRTPVVLPSRLTDDLMKIISQHHIPGKREIALVTHFEHPYEITPQSMQAVQQFRKRGMSVYNQTVFTLENSRKFELVALRKLLRLIGVDPYYTFNTKGKEETKAYRVPLARLQQEVKEEARLIPGLVRTDEPVYNVPKLGKNYIRAQQHHRLLTLLPDGRRVYEFHPWEKNLSLADSFIDTDVSIYEYLKELKQRGENIEDYRSIWYYF